MERLASALVRALEEAPLSLRAIAREAGLSHSTLVLIAKGKMKPTPKVARAVSVALLQLGGRCVAAADRIERELRQAEKMKRKPRRSP